MAAGRVAKNSFASTGGGDGAPPFDTEDAVASLSSLAKVALTLNGGASVDPADATRSGAPVFGEGREAGVARTTPHVRLTVHDCVHVLIGARGMLATIFLAVLLGSVAVLLGFQKRYVAEARLVLAPSADAGMQGLVDPEYRMRSYATLFRSNVVAGEVIGSFGVRKMYPNLQTKEDSAAIAALAAFDANLKTSIAPKTGDLTISFASHDRDVADRALQRLIAAVRDVRRVEPGANQIGVLGSQRRAFEQRLTLADENMKAFLRANKLSDFRADLAAASALSDNLAHDVADTQAQLVALEARLQSLRAAANDRSGDPEERAALALDVTRVQVDATSLTRRLSVLKDQAAAAYQARAGIIRLKPEFERLALARETVAQALQRFTAREEDARAADSMRRAGLSDLRHVGGVSVSWRPALSLGAGMLAVLVALLATFIGGLVRLRGYRRYPTPESVERALGVPVLATVPAFKERSR